MKISRRKTRAPYEFDEEYRGTRWRDGKTVSRASKGLILFCYGGRYECQLHRGYASRNNRKVLSFDYFDREDYYPIKHVVRWCYLVRKNETRKDAFNEAKDYTLD